MAASDASKIKAKPGSVSEEVIRKSHRHGPMGAYNIKDQINKVTSNPDLLDAILITLVFVFSSTTFQFYPLPLIAVIAVVLFFITLKHSFLGLLSLLVAIFPIFAYQTPVLAWAFLLVAAAVLIYGYMHYRIMIFALLLTTLAFSPAGYLLEIPAFILAVLTIGNKRALLFLLLSIMLIVPLSAVTGLQNSGYILYSASVSHSAIAASPLVPLDTAAKAGFTITNLGSGLATTFENFFSNAVVSQINSSLSLIAQTWAISPAGYIIQFIILGTIIFAMDWYASLSRSKYKGSIAGMFGIVYPLTYILFSSSYGFDPISPVLPLISFVIAPATLYVFESQGISLVKVLDVRKQDIRMKFGEAFEDLAGGTTTERFEDIGNYEDTKKELREAIIAPIEERAIATAYNIAPTKGILLFGPPGTGKTMMMRALANEIRAGFYYVKASNLVSAFPGETEKQLANIFSIAKKNAPCVLFFDEIDALATSRDATGVDDTHKHALTQLLTEMDGFQKINNVIIVGATNRPDILDNAILRPGRFDRLIYMPEPTRSGRARIFKIYLGKLPISNNVKIKELAEKTERYTGADIKALCESVAQMVAQDAATEHKILEITHEDILGVIKATKPSTTLSQIDDYKRFKMDFERSSHKTIEEVEPDAVSMEDVIGLEPAKKAIREAIEIPLLHPEMIKKYSIKTVNGVLLFGPPGNGKTLLMKAVQNSMKGIAMLSITGSDLSEQGLERATATIKDIFERARENAPSVIFIDEIDALLPKRQGASELSVSITTEVLKEIDGINKMENVVVIGATNLPQNVDTAVLRPGRFDRLLFIKPPSAAARTSMFNKFLTGAPSDTIDYSKLGSATKGYTGADIAEICRKAKTAAMQQEIETGSEGRVTTEVIENIIKDTKPSASDSVLAEFQGFLDKYGQR